MSLRLAFAALVAAVALGACSSPAPASAPAPSSPTSAAVTPDTTPAAATPTADPNVGLRVGATATLRDGATVQVLEVRPTMRARGVASGMRWFAVMARTCVPSASTLSWSPWSALDADGGTYPASSETYGDWPRPLYPFAGEPMAAGCRKGWILFPVPSGAKVSEVAYSVDPGDGSAPLLASWRI